MVELIMFIVIVGFAMAGVLMVIDVNVRASADPMVRKQAIVLADSLMEEVLLRAFDDPDGNNAGEVGRADWDNVADYNNIDEVINPAGPVFLGMPPNLNGSRIRITVVDDPVALGIPARRVTVTVNRGAEEITMTGLRTNF